jgi:hypothetical protein
MVLVDFFSFFSAGIISITFYKDSEKKYSCHIKKFFFVIVMLELEVGLLLNFMYHPFGFQGFVSHVSLESLKATLEFCQSLANSIVIQPYYATILPLKSN